MPPKDKYTDPELRDQVKEEIHESDKGGAPGQWSARKAQMMAAEYKKRGGTYNTDKSQQDASQANLSKWSEEEWQTKEGSGNAKQSDGTEKRYLPKEAWEKMDDDEKEETEEKKLEGSKEGKQFVGNTEKAKESRAEANEKESREYEGKQRNARKAKGKGKGEEQEDDSEGGGEEEEAEDDEGEYQDDGEADADGADEGEEVDGDDGEPEDDDDSDEGGEDAKAGQKRKGGQPKGGANKSQKGNSGKSNGGTSKSPASKSDSKGSNSNSKSGETVGSKHQPAEAPAPQGSSERLPKKGQKVTWKALPGYVEGEVVEIVTEEKEVDGKMVKGSEKDPRVVMKSSSSGKIAVHKPDACYFD